MPPRGRCPRQGPDRSYFESRRLEDSREIREFRLAQINGPHADFADDILELLHGARSENRARYEAVREDEADRCRTQGSHVASYEEPKRRHLVNAPLELWLRFLVREIGRAHV